MMNSCKTVKKVIISKIQNKDGFILSSKIEIEDENIIKKIFQIIGQSKQFDRRYPYPIKPEAPIYSITFDNLDDIEVNGNLLIFNDNDNQLMELPDGQLLLVDYLSHLLKDAPVNKGYCHAHF